VHLHGNAKLVPSIRRLLVVRVLEERHSDMNIRRHTAGSAEGLY